MKETFTREEVLNVIISLFIISGANGNQGLKVVTGNNYGDKAENVLKAHESLENGETIITAVRHIRTGEPA